MNRRNAPVYRAVQTRRLRLVPADDEPWLLVGNTAGRSATRSVASAEKAAASAGPRQGLLIFGGRERGRISGIRRNNRFDQPATADRSRQCPPLPAPVSRNTRGACPARHGGHTAARRCCAGRGRNKPSCRPESGPPSASSAPDSRPAVCARSASPYSARANGPCGRSSPCGGDGCSSMTVWKPPWTKIDRPWRSQTGRLGDQATRPRLQVVVDLAVVACTTGVHPHLIARQRACQLQIVIAQQEQPAPAAPPDRTSFAAYSALSRPWSARSPKLDDEAVGRQRVARSRSRHHGRRRRRGFWHRKGSQSGSSELSSR